MFRYTATFLVLFLVINHDFAAARTAEFLVPQRVANAKSKAFESDVKEQKTDEVKRDLKDEADTRVRDKRKVGALFTAGSSLTFLGSTAVTIYHAIQKCNDYRPIPCKTIRCKWLSSDRCPDICHGPNTNRGYVNRERQIIKNKLKVMNELQQDAFNLATSATTASINNHIILTKIADINFRVERLVDKILDAFDPNFAKKLTNTSFAIKTMLTNEKLSLDQIVGSQEVDGIFDEWTWEGTFTWILGTTFGVAAIGWQTFKYFKKRNAIRSIYKDLVKQKLAQGSASPSLKNTLASRQKGLSNQMKSELKQAAKTKYRAQNTRILGNKKINTAVKIASAAVNFISIALSLWSTYEQISNCFKIANDMQDTAEKMAITSDRIEMIKQTYVEPVYTNVTTKLWPSVRAVMTNENTTKLLKQVLNLTLGAKTPNKTIVNTINSFIATSPTSSNEHFVKLQKKLIDSLQHVHYKYACLSNKQNAIAAIVKECKRGDEPFPVLYKYATDKHQLNDAECMSNKMYPYTSQNEIFSLLKPAADHQGWYMNCFLNNDGLLGLVCEKKVKGYTTPKEIVVQMNQTSTWKGKVSEDMVSNFLGRCPPPPITDNAITTTCEQNCLNQPIDKIAKLAVLLECQVKDVIKTDCAKHICDVKPREVTKICYQHYCKGQNATTIEKDIEKPFSTVNHVIAHNCSKKCVIPDHDLKNDICMDYKCNNYTVEQIATSQKLIKQAILDNTSECDKLVTSCVVPKKDKERVLDAYCKYGIKDKTVVSNLTKLSLAAVNRVIEEHAKTDADCENYKKNGLP